MLEPVIIDISEVIDEFSLSEQEIKSLSSFILTNVVDNYTKKWDALVDQNLYSTRGEYKKGMFVEYTDDSVITGLTPRQSQLSLMIEEGSGSFDEKEGFSKSDKKKLNKDGKWYLTVPFRWATSEALGESMTFSNKMPKPIEKLVKVAKSPLKFEDLPPSFQKKGVNKTSGYNHQFTIYEGLHRVESGSGKEKRGVYMSFRRAGENSDPESWMHPGFEAHKLMEKAFSEVNIGEVVDFSFNEFMKGR